MRQPIIIGNWKMNMSIADGTAFVQQLDKLKDTSAQIGVAPQFVAIPAVNAVKNEILVGAQNVNDHLSGAYTGEVSVDLLKEIKTDFCIIGHSERRQYYNETDNAINTKAKLLQEKVILPVICVGETEAQYDNNETDSVIATQVKECCKDLDIVNTVVAYEPIWAIGTGKSASEKIAQDVCAHIRDVLAQMYNEDLADKVRVIYGGSVNDSNIKEYMAQSDVDGALVGGASLKIDAFTNLINYK
ncbi:triose-phosphate isomerase [Mycoplasma sp. P36-A1]|uniref:triose-phosphate isomerase n=1 Tax=Mycoplasma sp. P36-A1 TaxID=3252900 RepID=UPI003C307956